MACSFGVSQFLWLLLQLSLFSTIICTCQVHSRSVGKELIQFNAISPWGIWVSTSCNSCLWIAGRAAHWQNVGHTWPSNVGFSRQCDAPKRAGSKKHRHPRTSPPVGAPKESRPAIRHLPHRVPVSLWVTGPLLSNCSFSGVCSPSSEALRPSTSLGTGGISNRGQLAPRAPYV